MEENSLKAILALAFFGAMIGTMVGAMIGAMIGSRLGMRAVRPPERNAQ